MFSIPLFLSYPVYPVLLKWSVICAVSKAKIHAGFDFCFDPYIEVSSIHIPSDMGHLNLPVFVFLDYFHPVPGYFTVSV